MANAHLKAVLGLDSGPFKAGMKSAEGSAANFRSMIGKVGAAIGISFSVGAIISFGKSVMQWASNISTAAENAGMLTSEMMAINRVAVQTGNTFDEVGKVIAKIKTEMDKAIRGSEESREKFERLGVSMKDLAGMKPADQLMAAMPPEKESGQPLVRMAEIVGERLGPRFVKFINQATGPDGIGKISAELGEAADNMERLGSKMALMGEKNKAFWANVFGQAASNFEENLQYLTDFYTGGAGFAEQQAEARRTAESKPEADRATAQEKAAQAAAAAFEKGEQDRANAIREGVKKEREARLEGEDKINAEYRRKRAEVEQQIADGILDGGGVVEKALYDRLQMLDDFYEADIKKMRDAEKEKNDIAYKAAIEYSDKIREERERPIIEEVKRLQAQGLDAPSRASGRGIRADALATVGGFLGNERAGMGIADKQLQIATEQKSILAEIDKKIGELRTARGGGL